MNTESLPLRNTSGSEWTHGHVTFNTYTGEVHSDNPWLQQELQRRIAHRPDEAAP